MQITQEAILKTLSRVQDPDLKRDLVSLGMIQDIEISSDVIRMKVVLTTPACPLKHNVCAPPVLL